jgi:hypothetical protein
MAFVVRMAKRNKVSAAESRPASLPDARTIPQTLAPPEKRPTLLTVSVVLFALWFTFLLVTALSG